MFDENLEFDTAWRMRKWRLQTLILDLTFQMTNIDKQHEIVKASLNQFVNTYIKAADLSVVDEIVLNYVISILEEASEDPNIDLEGSEIPST